MHGSRMDGMSSRLSVTVFYFPKINGKEAVYFTGNSLGLQPKAAERFLKQELEDWAKYGVEGHF